MKKAYLVTVREVFTQDVIVWADDKDQADEMSCELANTGEIDASSLSREGQGFDREIEVVEELDDDQLKAFRRFRYQEVGNED